MKAFTIFPAICVFALTLTLLNLGREMKFWKSIIIATIFTAFFGRLMTWYSLELFFFLYFINIIGILVLIPCLTFWTNRMLPAAKNTKIYWIRIAGLGVAATVIALLFFGASMLLGFFYNPMDPPR